MPTALTVSQTSRKKFVYAFATTLPQPRVASWSFLSAREAQIPDNHGFCRICRFESVTVPERNGLWIS
jgi:hypothetical protein